ncbi:MAG: DUF1579 family protein [Acidobacteriota bacterium]
MKRLWIPRVLTVLLLGFASVAKTSPPSPAPPAAPAAPCSGPEHRRLDFWVGDWDAFDAGADKPSARVKVEVVLGGCALREVYEGVDGLHGESFTSYDASRKLWHQTWVTNRGDLLQIDGRFDRDTLTLQGPRVGPDGRVQIVRGVWKPQGDGVREIADRSSDGGKTWQPWFDISFKRRQH